MMPLDKYTILDIEAPVSPYVCEIYWFSDKNAEILFIHFVGHNICCWVVYLCFYYCDWVWWLDDSRWEFYINIHSKKKVYILILNNNLMLIGLSCK